MNKTLESWKEKEFSSIRKTAREYKVPLVTLFERIKGKSSGNVGRPTAMTLEEESLLSKRCLLFATWGFPLTKYDVRKLLQNYYNRKGITNHRQGYLLDTKILS